MNQRLTRKDMKRDEFATAVGRGVEYAESHARTIFLAAGAVVLLVILAAAFVMVRNQRAEAANEALARAIQVYQAPIDPTGARPDDPQSPTFADAAARQARAKELFQELREDYGSTDAGDVAAIFLAQFALAEGNPEEARNLWAGFIEEHGDHLLADQTRVNLIHLDRSQGKGEEVVQTLTAMLEEADPPLPQDLVLHELAVTQEELGRAQEAVQSYQRILDEHPQSPYAGEARQRIAALDPARAGSAGAFPPGVNMPGF